MEIKEKQNYQQIKPHFIVHNFHDKLPLSQNNFSFTFQSLTIKHHQNQPIKKPQVKQVDNQVMEWFFKRNIVRGDPQDLIQRMKSSINNKSRQIFGNGAFLARFNVQNSALLKKRIGKLRD